MAPAIFALGDEVEVMSQVEGFDGLMFEARIVKLQSNRNQSLIEYDALVDDLVPAKNLQETVDRAHIHPRPPRCGTSGFEIGEKIDALYNDGWWAGEISKVLEGGKRYRVRFCAGNDDYDEETEFGFDEIRVHLDWIDGKWIGQKIPLERLSQLVTEEKSIIKRERQWEERMANTVVEKEGIELKRLDKQKEFVVKRNNYLKHFVRKRWKQEDGDCLIRRENENQETGKAGEPSNGGNCTSHIETVIPELSDNIVDSNTLVQHSEDQKEAQDEALPLSGSQVAKTIDIKDRTEANGASHGEEPHDQSGSLPAADQEAKVTEGGSTRILTDHTSKKTYLPFSKISPMWTLIESSEVFSLMPQNPHFLPLMQVSKESREGTAIGLMVTYANLVNSVRKLRTTDTDHTLQEMMETLIDLERHGFSVENLQGLLREFQILKDNQKQILVRRSALEGLILERRNKKDEFDAKFELIASVVMRLEQSLEYFRDEKASIFKQRKGNDQEILKLQNDMRAIEESCLAAERSFLNALDTFLRSSANTG